jgi:uncharacterized protein YlaI
MPVYTLECPDCHHRFKGMVIANAEPPREWACSQCGSRRAKPAPDAHPETHPFERAGASGCPCCG